MSDPAKTKPKTEDQYVSPTSDETLRERYERVHSEEAEMSEETRLAALRAPSPLFDESEESADSP